MSRSTNDLAHIKTLEEIYKRHSAATPQPNVDDVAVWTELECVIFPSSQRRGGCAIKNNVAKPPKAAQTGWSVRLAFEGVPN